MIFEKSQVYPVITGHVQLWVIVIKDDVIILKRCPAILNFCAWSAVSKEIYFLQRSPKENKNEGQAQVSHKRLALRLFTFRYTSVPSKILWKSCFGNCFFFPLIAESHLRKVREGKQPTYNIFSKHTFAQFFFLQKMSGYQISTFVGLFLAEFSNC